MFIQHFIYLYCFQTAGIITKTNKEYHFYYRYRDKLNNNIKQNLGYDIKNNTNVTGPLSCYEYTNGVNDSEK